MLKDLEKIGRDKITDYVHAFAGLLGFAGGAASATTIAGLAGATSITGLTTVASWVGLTIVSATPIGWVAGTAAAGGALVLGVGVLLRKGGAHDEKHRILKENIKQKIKEFKARESQMTSDEQFKNIIHMLRVADLQKKIRREDGLKILAALETGQMSNMEILDIIDTLANDHKKTLA